MSMRTRQILSDPGLLAALQPGETARTYVQVSPTNTGAVRDTPVGTGPTPPEHRSAGEQAAAIAAGNYLPDWARGEGPDRAVGGVARQGDAFSTAAGLEHAQRSATGLVVTDRRLVAVVEAGTDFVPNPDQPGKQMPSTTYAAVWSTPVTDVVAARRNGRLVGRGRVELYFRDASMCAVVTGVLTTGAADRLLETLAVPTPPVSPT